MLFRGKLILRRWWNYGVVPKEKVYYFETE